MILLQAVSNSNTINWPTILIALLGSSVIGTFLSYIFSLNTKKVDFRFDHKKYIVKRRLEVYERIEPFITEIYNGYYVYKKDIPELDNDVLVQKFFTPKDYNNNEYKFLSSFYDQTIKDWYWYSSELRKKINDTFGFLRTIRNKIDSLEKNDYNLVKVANEHFKEIENKGIILITQHLKDIKKMHDVESFINDKN